MIGTPEGYRAAKERADELMGNVEEGSPEAAELELLATLIERYEHGTFPIDPPSLIEAITFRAEQAPMSEHVPEDMTDLLVEMAFNQLLIMQALEWVLNDSGADHSPLAFDMRQRIKFFEPIVAECARAKST